MAILSSPVQYITSTPPTTRGLIAGTVLFSLAYIWIQWHDGSATTPYLTLIPGASVFYPWTFFTSGLVETSIIEVSYNATYLIFGRVN